MTWGSSGGDVCVERTQNGYEFLNETGALIQHKGGGPVTLYVDGDITFDSNQSGVKGGLYSTGNVTVEMNNNAFGGQPDKLGGLALYAEGDLTIVRNNVTLQGIAGSDERLTLEGRGGGTKNVAGIVIGRGGFTDGSNSNARRDVVLDRSAYQKDALTGGGWSTAEWAAVAEPLFAHTRTYLID